MPIVEPVIRPPAEAESFLLQVTLGCSSNGCTFCGAYLKKPFRVKSDDEIVRDIEEGGQLWPDTRRVFLLDGDALAMSQARLLPILKKICQAFPRLCRISSYANGYNMTQRSDSELKELYEHKLKLVYIGLESGSQLLLNQVRKRATVREMIRAVQRAAACQIKSSVIVILGLGGRRYSQDHVRETIHALNQMQPRYLSFLTLMLIPRTPLAHEAKEG
ncbi:MAG: radical SAM protein, partial [Candidatus Omnitrophica bacterium]|nr:radical SAM protein [Candidatus Omnitrophota bacterium]